MLVGITLSKEPKLIEFRDQTLEALDNKPINRHLERAEVATEQEWMTNVVDPIVPFQQLSPAP